MGDECSGSTDSESCHPLVTVLPLLLLLLPQFLPIQAPPVLLFGLPGVPSPLCFLAGA